MIVWAKPNPMPESCKDRPTDAYEHIIMLTKAERYFWDADAVKELSITNDPRRPYTSEGAWELDGRDQSKRHGGEIREGLSRNGGDVVHGNIPGRSDGGAACNDPNQLFRNLRNVWQFATQPCREAHFATFPEELPRRCIMAASRVGDTVLDPFAGSGTVGRVAVQLNRKAILNDLAYHDLSEKRTRNVQRQLV